MRIIAEKTTGELVVIVEINLDEHFPLIADSVALETWSLEGHYWHPASSRYVENAHHNITIPPELQQAIEVAFAKHALTKGED